MLTWKTGHLFVRAVSFKMTISTSSLCERENLNTWAMTAKWLNVRLIISRKYAKDVNFMVQSISCNSSTSNNYILVSFHSILQEPRKYVRSLLILLWSNFLTYKWQKKKLELFLIHDLSMVSYKITKGGALWPLHDTSFIHVFLLSLKIFVISVRSTSSVEKYSNIKAMHKWKDNLLGNLIIIFFDVFLFFGKITKGINIILDIAWYLRYDILVHDFSRAGSNFVFK
jgi:hypothetical protein